MNYLQKTFFLVYALLWVHSAAAETLSPTPAAQQIIEELGLKESDTALRDNPAWNPQRIVVSLPAGFAQRSPGLQQQLEKAAGSVTLVIDSSENMVPSAEVLAGADAIISLCTQAIVDNASPRLLWLHSYTAGVDGCSELSPAQIEGRVFTNSKRLMGPAIAEHAMAMLLSLASDLPAYHQAKTENRWDRSPANRAGFGELRGKTLLVVGLGGIGTEIAWRADSLGMKVLATRNSSREGPDFVEYVGLPDELSKLASRADVIINALPLTESTTAVFNREFFDVTKAGAIFISVGRGASTVTADLITALESGKLYGAGLDVTDPEPLPKDSALWQMSNVIITPHVAATGADSMKRVAAITVENLRRYVEGGRLLNIVNMKAGY
jgi:phosphoglycerate dehydrogenase-like enzyme